MAYIDKELFKQDIKMRYCNNCARPNEIKCRACHVDDMLGEIEDAPTADVVEVKHGEWIEKFKDGFWYYDCPFCDDGYVVMERDENKPNYCHNCGAKMDGGKTE